MDDYDWLSMLVAACCHDFEHPGVNNVFLVNMHDPIAVKHNDISVLENHHIAAAFDIMSSKPETNWMSIFDLETFQRVRKMMIQAVLSTDMRKHF